MGKKNFKNMIIENQRLNNIKIKMVHLSNQSVDNNDNNKKNNKKDKNIKKMKNNKQTVFMAIAKGRESVEPIEAKRYTGIANCHIVAINPNKATLDMLYGRPSEKEPNYLGEAERNGMKVPQARIDILFKLGKKYLDENGQHIDTIFRKSIFLTKIAQATKEGTKVKVVDEFGNTAWVTNEQLTVHEVPMYKNGPASIMKDYRPLYHNEEVVMNIAKTFLHTATIRINAEQQPMKYNNASQSWEVTKDASDGLIRFDTTDKFFSGDFKELQDIPSYQPKNTVKVLFGVKNSDGKMYQDIFDIVLSSGTKDEDVFKKFTDAVNEAKANNRYANTDFYIGEFGEYKVTPTNFNSAAPSTADPFANADDIF